MPPRLEAQTGASLRCDTNSITLRNQLRTYHVKVCTYVHTKLGAADER